MKITNVIDVARWRLCLGCGACASVCRDHGIKLVDVENEGIRPFWVEGCGAHRPEDCQECRACLDVCPGLATALTDGETGGEGIAELRKRWGTVLDVWEGYASDPEIRYSGSSGGLCTALSLFFLETGLVEGVLQTGGDPERPCKNKTFRTTTREELLFRTGSRYSPASPCDGFKRIEDAGGRSLFVGKPCDVAGLRMAQQHSDALARKTALAIGFFCAGTPSTQGTLALLGQYGVESEHVSGLRYRGMGWPGMATVNFKDQAKSPLKLTYEEAWGFVQKYRPIRCYLCPDLTAEFADISVGDPWYRKTGENDPGRSLILVRTLKGREILQQAMDKNYVTAEKADPGILYRSQENLLGKRQAIWGRLLAMKLLGIPRPELKGFHLFENWLDLKGKEKIKSILGTARRIIQRNYFKPQEFAFKEDSCHKRD